MFTFLSRKPKMARIVLKCRQCGTEESWDVSFDLLSHSSMTIYSDHCDCDRDGIKAYAVESASVNTYTVQAALVISKGHRNITQNYGLAIEQLEIAVRELLKPYLP